MAMTRLDTNEAEIRAAALSGAKSVDGLRVDAYEQCAHDAYTETVIRIPQPDSPAAYARTVARNLALKESGQARAEQVVFDANRLAVVDPESDAPTDSDVPVPPKPDIREISRGIGSLRALVESWLERGEVDGEFGESLAFFVRMHLGAAFGGLALGEEFVTKVNKEAKRLLAVAPGLWTESDETLGVPLPVRGRRTRVQDRGRRNPGKWFPELRAQAARSLVAYALRTAGLPGAFSHDTVDSGARRDATRQTENLRDNPAITALATFLATAEGVRIALRSHLRRRSART